MKNEIISYGFVIVLFIGLCFAVVSGMKQNVKRWDACDQQCYPHAVYRCDDSRIICDLTKEVK
jgi:hypothetical protein